jgi:hypothetical protein
MIWVIAAVFAAYVAVTVVQARRATRAIEPAERLREARRLLWAVTAGVPILVVLILVAF